MTELLIAGSLGLSDDALTLRLTGARPREAIDALMALSDIPDLALRVFTHGSRRPGSLLDLSARLDHEIGPHRAWDRSTPLLVRTEEGAAVRGHLLSVDGSALSLTTAAVHVASLTTPETIREAFGAASARGRTP